MIYKLYKYRFDVVVSEKIKKQPSEVFKWFVEGQQSSQWELCHEIQTIHMHGFDIGFDYKFVRDEIKKFYFSDESGSNFYELQNGDERPIEERLIFCEHKIGSHQERKSIVGQENVVKFGLQYHSKVSECKKVRLAYAIGVVHNYLPEYGEDIKNEAFQEITSYLLFGDEGKLQGNKFNGISDYFRNVLIQKEWQPENGLTMEQVVEQAETILFKGIY